MPLPMVIPAQFYHWAQAMPVPDSVTLGEAAETFTGLVLLYFARVVLRLDKTVGTVVKQLDGSEHGEGGITMAVRRIEEGYNRVNNAVMVQGAQITTMQDEIRDAMQKVSGCPYHGQDRRRPDGA